MDYPHLHRYHSLNEIYDIPCHVVQGAPVLAEWLKGQEKVFLVVLDQDINTTTPTGKLMFTMIGAFAEFERDLINERCKEGIAKAKERGVRFGRRRKLSDKQLVEMKAEFEEGVIGKTELAKKYGI